MQGEGAKACRENTYLRANKHPAFTTIFTYNSSHLPTAAHSEKAASCLVASKCP